jgi:hypothetical protein
LVIQSLIKENQNEDIQQQFEITLKKKAKEFKKFCNLLKNCCKKIYEDQIQDFNEILSLNYKEIRMRFSKSFDPRCENLDKRLMEIEINKIIANSNRYHYQNIIQAYEKQKNSKKIEKHINEKNGFNVFSFFKNIFCFDK